MREQSFIHSGGLLGPVMAGLVLTGAIIAFVAGLTWSSGDKPTRRILARTRLLLPPKPVPRTTDSKQDKQTGETGRKEASDAGGGAAAADKLQLYAASILRRIDRAKRFPEDEEGSGKSGIVSVEVKIGGDGRLLGLRIIAPSAHAAFNGAALQAVRRASPFPAIPADLRRDSLALRVQVRFIARRFNDDE